MDKDFIDKINPDPTQVLADHQIDSTSNPDDDEPTQRTEIDIDDDEFDVVFSGNVETALPPDDGQEVTGNSSGRDVGSDAVGDGERPRVKERPGTEIEQREEQSVEDSESQTTDTLGRKLDDVFEGMESAVHTPDETAPQSENEKLDRFEAGTGNDDPVLLETIETTSWTVDDVDVTDWIDT